MDFNEYYKARDIIQDLLEKDLLGPVSEEEIIINELPSKYYSTGILYPRETPVDEEEKEGDMMEDTAENYDTSIDLSNSANPSSMAISFTLKPGIDKFVVESIFAWYELIEDNNEDNSKKNFYGNWKRQSHTSIKTIDLSEAQQTFSLHNESLYLEVYLQKTFSDGAKTVTVAMVNKNSNKEMSARQINLKSYFQPRIRVKAEDGKNEIFIEKQMRVQMNKDEELRIMELLYRHNKNFALGHGCSVEWKASENAASEIYTTFLPEYELLQMKPAFNINENILSQEFLANGDRDGVCSALRAITDSYSKWIEKRKDAIKDLPNEDRGLLCKNINLCEESRRRIDEGIQLLKNDDIFQAFQLANRAMLEQRIQHFLNRGENFDITKITWYPFQLAFILQELPSVADPENGYRDVVDLLWFPTGGGKTEAYLGLAAFTIFLRRLRAVKNNRSGAGVTSIMRYTLRLLTIQQFQRAASLICACEIIRRDNEDKLGKEKIEIGLWVGGGLTPNNLEKAQQNLHKVRTDGLESLYEGNPCQVLKCPWCGSDIKPAQYSITDEEMIIYCPDSGCSFSGGIPVRLIDEDIYKNKPSLIIGTVDKFARMTWAQNAGEIFNLNSDLLPPELIIQDELHLISGPLGTVVALYELAVNKLCENNGIGPKVISSTATIRNARNQILNLYGKEFRQFPSQGTDIRDSFFAEESDRTEKPERKYMGIMTPGKSPATLLVRVYAAAIYATRYLKDLGFSDEVIDSFWTITGYFNSLRELGGAVVQVLDDVQARFKYLYGTKFNFDNPHFTSDKRFDNYNELTSRKPSSEIARILKKIETSYPSESVYDFILASNMISVGVDVGRLGLMIVDGQPKTSAEYIQATSRVGRQTPGLVLTMYNASRSRDRSHYEQFVSYHSSLYKYVEATSLTPFSGRARDRALHAVLVSLCRHLISNMADNNGANKFEKSARVQEFVDYILTRVNEVDPLEYEDTERQLNYIVEQWASMTGEQLVYQKFKENDEGKALLCDFYEQEEGFPTLNSMRNVDVESNVYLEVE